MKSILLFMVSCIFSLTLSAETITYYVETTGSNTNDGLSVETAFDSISTALETATAAYTADAANNDFIIEVGAGTFTESWLTISNVTVNINGKGANATILQGTEELSTSGIRLFQNCSKMVINLNNLTVQNYGAAKGTASGNCIIDLRGTSQTVNASNVSFSNIIGSYAPFGAVKNGNTFSFESCSFSDITATNASNLFFVLNGNLTFKNCMMINCVREYLAGSTSNTASIFLHSKNASNINLNFTNNTFVECGIVNGGDITITNTQSLILSKQDMTFANNIICGNVGTDGITYVDLSATGGSYTSACSNNIFTTLSSTTFPTDGNTIIADLTYDDAEVDFDLENDGSLALSTTTTGINYAVAKGSAVVGMALASEQTATDITGAIRSNPGCVGAFEYQEAGAKEAQFITFEDFTDVRLSEASPITLEANASSGLVITYTSSDDNIATVTGNVVTPIGIGTVSITATQAGDDTYAAAPEITQDLHIGADTITYYVRADGDNSNDGLTEATALATLPTAASYAVNNGVSLVYIIDVNDTITNQASSNFNFTRDEDIKVIIKGSSAAQSVYQMKNDAGYDYVVEDKGRGAGRVFQSIQNAGTGSISLDIEDMTFRNFGFTNDNGGALFNLIYNTKVNVTMRRCNMERGIARSGALIQATNGETSIVFEDCYIGDMTAISRNINNSPITLSKNCSFSATNCVFSHCVKAAEQWGSNNIDSTIIQGNVISFTPSTDSTALVLINNTFIGDSALRIEAVLSQSAVMVYDTVNAQCTIANNLFVGGAAANTEAYYSVYIPEAQTTFGDSTNNVLSAQSGFVETGNDIFPGLGYDDVEVAFRMEDDYPAMFTTTTGVNYIIAEGSSVKGKALASIATDFDIAGNERGENPSIGAYEAGNEPSGLNKSKAISTFSIYPNPASDVVYIGAEVSQITIFDISGKMVLNSATINGQFDISNLAKGIYIVNATDKNGAMMAPTTLIKK